MHPSVLALEKLAIAILPHAINVAAQERARLSVALMPQESQPIE